MALDLLLVLLFVTWAVRNGLRARSFASSGPEAYFLAGRQIRGWRAGLSMAATQYAADTPLVVTGLVATAGIFALWRLWVYSVAFLLLGFLLAGPWRRSRVLTDAELAELRYAGWPAELLRYLKAVWFGVVLNCVGLAMVLLAATRIAEPLLTWHLWLPEGALAPLASALERMDAPVTTATTDIWRTSASNLISLALITLFTAGYAATGGLRSVIQTDVVQVLLALVATAAYAGVVLYQVGGPWSLSDQLGQLYGQARAAQVLSFSPLQASGSAAALVALLGVQWAAQANSDGTGYLAQRTMACQDSAEARKAAVVFTWVQTVLRTLLWLPIVVGLLVLYPLDGSADVALREATFVRGVVELLPPGLRGLMLVGLLAALASTLDTHLNWGASYLTNDLYRRLWCVRIRGIEPDPRAQVWVARGSYALILALAVIILVNLDSVGAAWRTSLVLGAGVGIPLLLRWIWHRHNAWGELVPIAVSLAITPPVLLAEGRLDLHPDDLEALRLVTVAALATVSSVTASMLTPPVPPERLRAFYRLARPPGFWGPVAQAVGDDPATPRRALLRGILATATGAASAFLVLIGLGTALLDPSWTTSGGALLAGLLLLPAWWRLGFRYR